MLKKKGGLDTEQGGYSHSVDTREYPPCIGAVVNLFSEELSEDSHTIQFATAQRIEQRGLGPHLV